MIDGANAHSRILACWLAAGLVTAGCGGSPSDLQLLPGGQGDASEDAGDVTQPDADANDSASSPVWVDEESWEGYWYSDVTCHELADGELCDGWDNDCDGLIDEDDSSCHCGLLGAPCAAGFECIDGICLSPDGQEVYVPGGTAARGGRYSFQPAHAVHVPPFAIDRYPVTPPRYRECVEAGLCGLPKGAPQIPIAEFICLSNWISTWTEDKALQKHPLNGVTWYQARNLCLFEGKRLCTGAEWEKAGRGGCRRWCDAGDRACCLDLTPEYPWPADDSEPCEVTDAHLPRLMANCCASGHLAQFEFLAVEAFPSGASPYGSQAMTLTVEQWVEDCHHSMPGPAFYWPDTPRDGSAITDPAGCTHLAVKGGFLSGSCLGEWGNVPTNTSLYTGFRCCRDVEEML